MRVATLALVVAAAGLGCPARAQAPAAPPPPRLLSPGRYEVHVGAPGERDDPASLWCELDVRLVAGRSVMVPSRAGSIMRCVQASVSAGGTLALVLHRLQPALERAEGPAPRAEDGGDLVGLDWSGWEVDGRSETWELVGRVTRRTLREEDPPQDVLSGWARVSVAERRRTRAWRARFLAAPVPDGHDPLAAVAMLDAAPGGDPELGEGWAATGRRAWPYADRADASWRVTAAPARAPASELPTPVEVTQAPAPDQGPGGGGPPPDLVLAVAFALVAGLVALVARRARTGPPVAAAPRPPRPPIRPTAALKAADRLGSFELGLASLQRAAPPTPPAGVVRPAATAPGRTAPVDAVLGASPAPVDRTAPVDAVLGASPAPVDRTAPVDAVLGASPAPADRTAPVDAVLGASPAPVDRTAPVDAVLGASPAPVDRTAPVDAVLGASPAPVDRTAPVDAVLGAPPGLTA